MELKLNIYKDRFCRKIDKTVIAPDFELSTGICEDVLSVLNVDMWDEGIMSLSVESAIKLILPIVRDGLPFFHGLIAELFEITEEEAKQTKISEVATIIISIAKYSFSQLSTSLGGSKNSKN